MDVKVSAEMLADADPENNCRTGLEVLELCPRSHMLAKRSSNLSTFPASFSESTSSFFAIVPRHDL